YAAGLALLARWFFPRDALAASLIFCVALSFYPFTWAAATGQPSTIGFLAMALAFREDQREHPFLSGLALSVCLYKPVLTVLFVPMLLLTRRFRTLIGYGAGAVAGAALATLVEGPRVWKGYLDLMFSFGRTHALTERSSLPLVIHVDIPSFSSQLA